MTGPHKHISKSRFGMVSIKRKDLSAFLFTILVSLLGCSFYYT